MNQGQIPTVSSGSDTSRNFEVPTVPVARTTPPLPQPAGSLPAESVPTSDAASGSTLQSQKFFHFEGRLSAGSRAEAIHHESCAAVRSHGVIHNGHAIPVPVQKSE